MLFLHVCSIPPQYNHGMLCVLDDIFCRPWPTFSDRKTCDSREDLHSHWRAASIKGHRDWSKASGVFPLFPGCEAKNRHTVRFSLNEYAVGYFFPPCK